jgi:SAM-dependent methyltransferase
MTPAGGPGARVGAAGARAGGPRAGVWTEKTVRWYERADARSDYAAQVLAALGPDLADCRDALDVGAGFGALTLPLARRLSAVTALEPAPAMARALRARAARAGLANIEVVEAAWGEVAAPRRDLVLCAHVAGLMGGDSPFLGEVGTVARRLVALVRDADAGRPRDKFFFGELYPVLLGRPYERCCGDVGETVAALRRLGVSPRVTPIEYASDQPFDDLGEACDFWMTYMGLEGEGPRGYLERFLGERLERRGSGLVAPLRKTAAVITWAPGSGRP